MSWKFLLPLLMLAMSVCAFYGAKFARVRLGLGSIIVICALSSILLMPPWIGWLLASYCMLRLVVKLSDAELWPDATIITVVAMLPAILLKWLLY